MSDIAFRRIRGRIVPIKLNKQQRETIKGGGIAAAGAAVALGGASVYKKAVAASAKLATAAFDAMTPAPKEFAGIKNKFRSSAQMTFDDVLAKTHTGASQKGFRAANRLAKLSSGVRLAAPVLGGGLLFYGGAKILNNSSKKKKLSPETTALVAATGGASLPYAVKQGKKIFEFGLQNPQQKMQFARSTAVDFAKKYGKTIFNTVF